MSTVLIVEDEIKLARVMADYLHHSGFTTHMLHDGNLVEHWVRHNHCDLILLDLMLPGRDGIELCKAIRAFSTLPIIMVTAKVDEIDRLLGLEIGADDYICKPFSTREVVSRVKVMLRRMQWQQPSEQQNPEHFSLDEDRYIAKIGGNEVELTAIEFKLLQALMNPTGRILSRAQLMDKSYADYRVVSDRTVDSHIKKLRKKLHDAAPEQEFIHSVYGVGYKFETPDECDCTD